MRPSTPRFMPPLILWRFTILTWSALAAVACACDTPVYRYAMYRWQPAPYELYCFCEGALDEGGAEVQATVERLAGGLPPQANVAFLAVDIQSDQELSGVPADIRDAWRKSPQQTPWYLVSSPVGGHLFSGTLTVDDVELLIDSARRREIGQLLEAGRAGVYVLVTGDDPLANEQAATEIRSLLDDLSAGRLSLYTPPTSAPEGSPTAAAPPEFGFITMARDDPGEKWLLDCLLAIEPDLRASAEPIAFLIYGRGRALFSSLGKGICRDNLEMDVAFITGACSCTVKEQNPGVDILMSYDWEAVSVALSERFGAEEGSVYRFGGDMLFPELIIPTDEVADASADHTDTPAAAFEQLASAAIVAPSEEPAGESGDAGAGTPPAERGEAAEPDVLAAVTPDVPREPAVEVEPAARAWQAMLWVGMGLSGALVFLLGATWLVLRPR